MTDLNRLWDDLRRPGVFMTLVVVVALAITAWSAWSLEDLRFLARVAIGTL
jgi:hypothetical protein